MAINTIKFKINRPTGKYKWLNYPTYDVIINKIKVGTISHKSIHDKSDRPEIGVVFRVLKDDILEDGNPDCEWKSVALKARFNEIEKMKNFLTENLNKIIALHKLYDCDKKTLI